MQPFDFAKNKPRIEKVVNERLKKAGLKDPEGFTLIEGVVTTIVLPVLKEVNSVGGKILPQVAVIGNSTGIVHYFYLEKLFPGEGLD